MADAACDALLLASRCGEIGVATGHDKRGLSMQANPVIRWIARLGLAALVLSAGLLVSGDAEDVAATSFNPTSAVTVTPTTPGAVADTTIDLLTPFGDSMWAQAVSFTPEVATIEPGPGNPSWSPGDPELGDIMGSATLTASFGLTNGTCSSVLAVPFTLLNGTVDNSGTIDAVPQADAGPLGILESLYTDDGTAPGASVSPPPSAPANGLPAHVDLYPAYLAGHLMSTQALARYSAATIVSGSVVTLELVVFSPGDLKAAFDPPHLYDDFDADMGYPMVVLFDDVVDPPSPRAITDVCSEVNLSVSLLGTSDVNPCAGNPGSPACDTPAEINAPSSGGPSGRTRYMNPAAAGTYVWNNWFQSLRDVDDDGIENQMDTCPYTANTDGDPRTTSGPDTDMLDSVCDPTPGGTNTNPDTDGIGIGSWLNAGDNCPEIGNNTQEETEWSVPYATAAPDGGPQWDGIGDPCDANPTVADGHYHVKCCSEPISIGVTDTDGDGWGDTTEANLGSCAANPCPAQYVGPGCPNCAQQSTPEHFSLYHPMPVAHSFAGGTTANPGLAKHPLSLSRTGEPYQVCNDGEDNDLDGLVDLLDAPTSAPADGCMPTISSPDEDGDGYGDPEEALIGTVFIHRCGVGAEVGPSLKWPSDLRSGGAPLDSTDRINILDVTEYLVPKRIGTSPGNVNYDPRWDLIPGATFPFTSWISINDLIALISGSTGFPPMFGGGTRAYNGPLCSPHPTYGD